MSPPEEKIVKEMFFRIKRTRKGRFSGEDEERNHLALPTLC
jgi:hypothetical protein